MAADLPTNQPVRLGYGITRPRGIFAHRATRWLAAVLLGVLIVATGGFVYVRFFFRLNLNLGPRAISPIAEVQWRKLSVGMTKAQVSALLGASDVKVSASTLSSNGQSIPTMPEFWEYNWTDGLPLFGPSAKAYAVYFDAEGRVSGWKQPNAPATTQHAE